MKATSLPSPTPSAHRGAIYALEKGLNPGTILSGGSDNLVGAWDLHTGTGLPFQARFPAAVYSLRLIPELNLLLAGTAAGSVHVIDLVRKEEIKILQHHTAQVFDIGYSLEHKSFYTLGGDGQFGHCSLENLSLVRIRRLSQAKLRQMDIHPSGKELAIACGDGRVVILHTANLEPLIEFPAHTLSANAVRYNPSGTILVTGGKDAHLKAWDIQQGYHLLHDIPAHNYAIYSIRFSPDNHYFATGSRDKTVKIWDAATFEFRLRINREIQGGHLNSVNTLYWSADPSCLVSAGDDRTILRWKIEP